MQKPVWKYFINAAILITCIVYLLALYYFTIGKSSAAKVNGLTGNSRINLVPFRTIIDYFSTATGSGPLKNTAIRNLLGNILLTLPLGVYIAYFFKPLGKLWKTLLASAIVILGIEVIQLLTGRGSFDVDDIILNLFGAAIGYGLWKIKPVQRIAEHIRL